MLFKRSEELCGHFSKSFMNRCREGLAGLTGASGGVFRALWELGESEDTGFTVEMSRIPVLQECIELCEYFGENPYELPFSGRIYLYDGEVSELPEGVVIGETSEKKARLIITREGIRYLNRPEETAL